MQRHHLRKWIGNKKVTEKPHLKQVGLTQI